MSRFQAASPSAIMGLGLLPFLVQCQLFGAPSIPLASYAPGPLTGLFGILGLGLPPAAAFSGMGFGGYPRDLYGYPSPMMDYGRSAAHSYNPYSNVVLPKLPYKYDSGIYKSAPIYEKPYSTYNYRQQYDNYNTYNNDPAYSTKSSYGKEAQYYAKDPQQYKQIYPKSSYNGQPYGSYGAFLKTILGGPSSSPAYSPSYSHDAPSTKTLLGNDYAGQPMKPQNQAYPKQDPEQYGPTPAVQYPDSKTIFPALFGQSEKPRPTEREVKEAYPKQQYQEVPQYQERKPNQNFFPDQKFPFPQFFGGPSFSFPAGPMSPYDQRGAYQDFPQPSFQQEKQQQYPDLMKAYPIPSPYPEKKAMSPYPTNFDSVMFASAPAEPRRQQVFTMQYDNTPTYQINMELKPGPAYPGSFALPPPPPQSPPGFDLTYENDAAASFGQPKAMNVPTYFTGARDLKQEYKSEPSFTPERKAAQLPQDESFTPAKYPTLGYEADQRKQVPSVIAALFGGGKYGKSNQDHNAQATAQSEQHAVQSRANQKAAFEASVKQQGGYSSNPANYEASQPQFTKESGGKYGSAAAQVAPVDIFVPVGRSYKQSDHVKTVLH